jgi:hypothetical protein
MMKQLFGPVVALSLFAASGAFAQSPDENGEPAQNPETAGEEEQTTQGGDVTAVVSTVTDSANRIQGAFDRFNEAMETADGNASVEALEDMLAAVRAVNSNLGRDSEAWSELETLTAEWTNMRDDLVERSKENPGLAEVAKVWQGKLDRISELKNSILDQSADSELLVEEIENKREIVLAYMQADQIDLVISEMEAMNAELTAMNDGMRNILDQTAGLEEGEEPVVQ